MSEQPTVRIPLFGSGPERATVVAHALVDGADAESVSEPTWKLHRSRLTNYAKSGGRIYMHRLILGLTKGDGIQVDHVNGDGLDNRRSNLRRSTSVLNAQNRRGAIKGKDLPRGVHFEKRRGYYIGLAYANGRRNYLGAYDTADEAENAVVAFRQEHMSVSHMDQTRPKPKPPTRRKRARSGSQSHRAKLTDDQVTEIRRRYAEAETDYGLWKAISEEFNISRATASSVARGLTWKDTP